MRKRNIILAAALVAVLISSSLFFVVQTFNPQPSQSSPSEFYVGVECGYDNVTFCKALIDKTKDYTNLFVLAATDIITNITSLNEVCDYAYNAGMHFAVYFSTIQTYSELGENLTDTITLPNGTNSTVNYNSNLPTGWIKSALTKYGDYFLGAYFFDEPGGNQLDAAAFRLLTSEKDYASAANAYTRNLTADIKPYLNTNVSTFTADYGLYWFDYKAGYDFVLADFGFNNSRPLQMALCRGAANAHGKDWGIMVTHESSKEQVLVTGDQLYNELVLSFDAGAKYALVFNFAETERYPKEPIYPTEYGILHEEHFDALQRFWDYMHSNPQKHESLKAEVALVLPKVFGMGFRSSTERIWGLFESDRWSERLFSDVQAYVNQYGSRLDIVYDDTAFNEAAKSTYEQVIYWTSNIAAENYPIINLNTSLGYNTIREAIVSGATSDGQVLLVKAGIYHENLIIDKSLTLLSEDKATTIIDASNHGTVVNITANNVTFQGFTIKNSGSDQDAGIYLDSVNCTLTDNVVENNFYGIYLNSSSGNTLKNNVMNGNVYNLGVDGTESAHFINSIDASNKVDGKKVYYLLNQHDLVVNPSGYPDVGYLAFINCTGVTAQDLDLRGNGNGILLVDTQKSNLINNQVSGCVEGIRMLNCEENNLKNSQLSGNIYNFWVQNRFINAIDTTNTVNGKPIYYWINQHDQTVPTNAGFVALINCSNITVKNLNLSENWQSLILSATTASTINQNQISNSYIGITLEASSQNHISQNRITNCTQALALSDSGKNIVAENELSHNQFGAYLNTSDFNTFSKNTITSNTEYGLQFTATNNNTISQNQIDNNQVGVEFMDSTGNTITKNNLSSNTQSIQAYGFNDHTTITENNISNSSLGIEVAQFKPLPYDPITQTADTSRYYIIPPTSSNHYIAVNNLTDTQKGIVINKVNTTTIADNTIIAGEYGIVLGTQLETTGWSPISETANNSVKGNTIKHSTNGIYGESLTNCSILDNQVIDGESGIHLSGIDNQIIGNIISCKSGVYLGFRSSGNLLRQNRITANLSGFGDDGIDYRTEIEYYLDAETVHLMSRQIGPFYFTNDVDTSNTINGKPIYYWVGKSDKTVPPDAACVILVNCTNITIENLNLSNNQNAILLAFTNNCTIKGNDIQSSSTITSSDWYLGTRIGRGIRMISSSNNLIEGNNIANNYEVISMFQIARSLYDYNTNQGTFTSLLSTGNTIVANNLTSNNIGINIGSDTVYGSSESDISRNTFYHNNLFNNTEQVNLPSQSPNEQLSFENLWDNGAEGNYWSDYTGTDTNGDGIGDSPYQIKEQTSDGTQSLEIVMAADQFPLINPFN
jgi:parallel beta-helix repeat protein